MCDRCTDPTHDDRSVVPARRKFLLAGAGVAAATLFTETASAAQTAATTPSLGTGPFSVRAYGSTSATAPVGPMQIQRRAVGANDVLLDVMYCGVCHSDIHQARNGWPVSQPTQYACVTGHEIIGRVVAIGNAVTKFRVGDIGGVGAMVDSCGVCETCLAGREQNCVNGATFTYNTPDRVMGGVTFGGYSERIVVSERFARAFAAQLPLMLDMSELNGNEKHADLPKPLPANANRPGTIRNGDLMLYGEDTLVVFYLTFQSSYSYTRLGRVDDPSDLPEALGPRGIRVVFSKDWFANERHKNDSAGWVLAALRLADGTCDPDGLVRARLGHNARRCHRNQTQWFTTVGEGTCRVVHRNSPHRSSVRRARTGSRCRRQCDV